jgi:2C-methyl-D-erythritol 2,4-cyclodiphosphate synthase
MVESLEQALTPLGDAPVAVKPKRAEGLGAIGRAEGIAAWSVALLSTIDGP